MNTKFSREVAKDAMFKIKQKLNKKDFFSSSPAPFVGHQGYPELNVGILSPVEFTSDAWKYDAPKYWAMNNMQIPQIIDYRSALINSRFKVNVHNRNKFLEIAQEVGIASKPVDIEFHLKEKPSFGFESDRILTPTGPKGMLEKAKVTSNPKVEYHVDKVTSDIDLKAGEALNYLYEKGYDENFLSRMLSIGTLGIGRNRKLVPTKWSITATDDTLGKNVIEEIKEYPEAEYMAFFGGYLGNYYLILVFPEKWSYELFEMSVPLDVNPWSKDKKFYATDYEDYYGRKQYASETAGGYYANRLPILNALKILKRQGTVISLRFITDEYTMPLGVWVVREASRNAMSSKPLRFSSEELMMEYARMIAGTKFGINVDNLLKNSVIIRSMKTQKKLKHFFK